LEFPSQRRTFSWITFDLLGYFYAACSVTDSEQSKKKPKTNFFLMQGKEKTTFGTIVCKERVYLSLFAYTVNFGSEDNGRWWKGTGCQDWTEIREDVDRSCFLIRNELGLLNCSFWWIDEMNYQA
ncbi:hypothetical protein AVEN_160907-1, partial [Araneus ventricosus]